MTFLRYWLAPLLLSAIILGAANDRLSGPETAGVLERAIAAMRVHVSPGAIDAANFFMRKAAHLTEYALLSALWFRAWRGERRGWRRDWAVLAVVLAIAVASADEWKQSFTVEREGTPRDVVLDGCGAVLAQVVIRRRAKLPA
jgi:VanZ family protein